jgi:hypothetical protein
VILQHAADPDDVLLRRLHTAIEVIEKSSLWAWKLRNSSMGRGWYRGSTSLERPRQACWENSSACQAPVCSTQIGRFQDRALPSFQEPIGTSTGTPFPSCIGRGMSRVERTKETGRQLISPFFACPYVR